ILFVVAVIFGTIFVQLNDRMLANQSPADSAWNLHVLAERQIRDGQLTQAKRNEELALVLLEQARPDEVQKTRTNICLRSLAALEELQGDTISAERRLKDALDFAQQAPGPVNSLLLDTRRQMADFYRKQNRIEDARKFEIETSNHDLRKTN
ncbi:MAG: tetratricopeptide repeat protein, partial [Candidatus Obscuribacterales bacterium]|nr:tetratricopeptide repeat protein [Candidatus Obscuribacterales bacterium]